MNKSAKSIAKLSEQNEAFICNFREVLRRSLCIGALAVAAQTLMDGDAILEMDRNEIVARLHDAIDLIADGLTDLADFNIEVAEQRGAA